MERKMFLEIQRASQESKITSTPRTRSPATVLSLSPSISSISNSTDYVPMEVDSESEDEDQENSLATEDLLSCESVSESRVKKVKKIRDIKWIGYSYSLKPKNKGSLYYKLMMQPNEIESIASDFINVYLADAQKGIMMILQLFVDLCGFKKLSVDKVYNFEDANAKEVVQRMGNDLMETELKKTGNFLFMRSSSVEHHLDHVLGVFLKELAIMSFKTDVLIDTVFSSHVFEFVHCMSFSSVKCICVTGIILVIKFITSFIYLYKDLLMILQDSNNSLSAENSAEKKITIETSIDFFYMIFEKNCLIPDKTCYVVKMLSAEEMFHWVKNFPEIFIFKRKCLGRLTKLALDPQDKVRKSAVSTCEKLINCEEIESVLSERIELVLKIVSTRIVDMSSKVAVEAIMTFTSALKSYPDYVKSSYKKAIISRIFEKNAKIAKVAGKFFASYLIKQYDEDEKLLLSLIKRAFSKTEYAERFPILLEACSEFIPQLKNWNLIVGMLLNTEISLQARKHLLTILCEMIRVSFTGKFSKNRQTITRVVLDSEQFELAVCAVIPKFEALAIQFQTDKGCLRQLTEMLTFIDYDYGRPEQLRKYYIDILILLKDLFNASNDKGLLENIATLLACFYERHNHYHKAKEVVEGIQNRYVTILSNDLKELSPSSERSQLVRVNQTSLKISILFEKLDMTKMLNWEDIFLIYEEDHYLNVLKYLVVCSKCYLLWSLRQFIMSKPSNDVEPVNNRLYNDCKDFVYSCLDTLRGDGPEHFLIFETLCNLYQDFYNNMKRKRQFSHFIIIIQEPNYQDILSRFVMRNIIENKSAANKKSLRERQILLNKFVNLIYLGVLPTESFSTVFRYYYTHFCDFGVTMNDIIQQLNLAVPGLPLVIVHTLIGMYLQILDKYDEVNTESDESKHLKLLARKFATLKEMKSSNCLKLLNMSLNFALTSKKYYPFLCYARYFAMKLTVDEKSDVLEILRNLAPKEETKDNLILLFASVLKSRK